MMVLIINTLNHAWPHIINLVLHIFSPPLHLYKRSKWQVAKSTLENIKQTKVPHHCWHQDGHQYVIGNHLSWLNKKHLVTYVASYALAEPTLSTEFILCLKLFTFRNKNSQRKSQ